MTLAYDGTDIDVDGELTFTVVAAAISGSAADLTATLAVAVAAAPALAATGTLTEANLNGAVVTLTLSGDTFAETVAAAQVRVSGLRGVEVSSLTRDGSTRLSVTLAYDGTDIDVDGELTFTVVAAAISGSAADLTATLAVAAAAAPALAATGTLTEANLNGAVVTLTLSGDTFAETVAAAQVRVSGLRGVEVSSLTRDGSTRLSVTLAYDGTDIDVDGELTFTVVAAAISGSAADLTATLAVAAAAAPALAATGTLTEANLNGAVVTLTLSWFIPGPSVWPLERLATAPNLGPFEPAIPDSLFVQGPTIRSLQANLPHPAKIGLRLKNAGMRRSRPSWATSDPVFRQTG